MSNSNKNTVKPTLSIANPYAKKKKPPPPSSSSSSSMMAASVPPPMIQAGASTFSQAFQSIDETSYYKQEVKNVEWDANQEKLREEQRALDMQENHHHQQQQQQERIIKQGAESDRDHHVLMQPHVLYVSTKQKGNGVLKFIRNVPFAYSKMVPDYIMSTTSCALFLSIKYHQLYPHYIHRRLAELKTDFKSRILLLLVDVEDNANALLYLNKLAVTQNMTLILAWTEQEAARYLETYKALNGKDASSIQKKESNNYVDQVADFLTGAKPVNKTDSANLLSHFSTVQAIIAASKDELALCPGLGQVKVQKLHDAFHKPFSTHATEKLKKRRIEEQQQQEENKDDDPAETNSETKEANS